MRDELGNSFVKLFQDLTEETREALLSLDDFKTTIKSIGCQSQEFFEVVETIPTTCDPLTQIIFDTLNPFSGSPSFLPVIDFYLNTVRTIFEQRGSKDTTLLIPIIPTMSKAEIVERLPSFMECPPQYVATAIDLIIQRPALKVAPDSGSFSPKDLLIELHSDRFPDLQVSFIFFPFLSGNSHPFLSQPGDQGHRRVSQELCF